MASVVIAGDTSGTVTLAAPAVAGTTTLTLPTANGTVITTGSSASLPISAISATGTPSATTYLRGDSTWATVSGGVTSLNGNTGALQGMTLLSTTNVTNASTFDITGIPTTAGATYLLQIQGRTVGSADNTYFSLRYSTNNGSTFATTAYSSSWDDYGSASVVNGYMGDAIRTTGSITGAVNIFSQIILSNGGTVNGSSVYPTAMCTLSNGDYENGDNYGRYYAGPDISHAYWDATSPQVSGAGTVRGATFNAIRVVRRTGGQGFTGIAKLFVLGV